MRSLGERIGDWVAARFGRRRPPEAGPAVRVLQSTYYPSTGTSVSKLLNDDTVQTVMNLERELLLGASYRWTGEDAEATGVPDLLQAIERADGFDALLAAVAACRYTQYAVAEIIWQTDGGAWLPAAYRVLPRDACAISVDATGAVTGVVVTTTAGQVTLPPERAVVARHAPTPKEPTGHSVISDVREIIELKRRADHSVIRYLERFAAPSILAYYQPGATAEAKRQLLDALKELQSASVATLPGPKETAEVVLLEAKGGSGSSIGSAIEVLQLYEHRIARALLGSTLSIYEAQFGTRAQAETHLEVLKAVIRARQAAVEAVINQQVLQRVLEYNRADAGQLDVRFELNEPDFADRTAMSRWVTDLVSVGVLDPEADREAIRSMFGISR